MDITNFLSIGIVGAVMSGIITMIKAKYPIDGYQTKLLTVTLSIVVGAVYVYLQSTPSFETIMVVLGSASTVYSLMRS
jgi:hypothetical protein